MNKNLLITLGIILLVVLGYFALQEEAPVKNNTFQLDGAQPHNMEQRSMEQPPSVELEIYKETVEVSFKESYSIDEEWSLIINQFEPDAKIMGQGIISSDSDKEINPAVRADFYKNGELVHSQISYKEMPGFHSVKPGQKYLLDLINYSGFDKLGDNNYSIETANIKIWRIK